MHSESDPDVQNRRTVLVPHEQPMTEIRRQSNGESLTSTCDLSALLGLGALQVDAHVLLPGRRAFPRHRHTQKEEMFYVMEGVLSLRLGDEWHEVEAGQLAALSPGPLHHSAENRSSAPARFLSISAAAPEDVVQYHPEEGVSE